jgi:hypothetical protein
MWQLQKEITDYSQSNNKGYFHVNADKSLSPYNRDLYPIKWSGLLNDYKVLIVQHGEYQNLDEFEFVEFPKSLEYLKPEIIQILKNYLDFSMK